MEVDFPTSEDQVAYRHGFEDCLDLVDDIINAEELEKIKASLQVVRASIQEKNVARIREDLGL
jgi:uncharacterized protein YerC